MKSIFDYKQISPVYSIHTSCYLKNQSFICLLHYIHWIHLGIHPEHMLQTDSMFGADVLYQDNTYKCYLGKAQTFVRL